MGLTVTPIGDMRHQFGVNAWTELFATTKMRPFEPLPGEHGVCVCPTREDGISPAVNDIPDMCTWPPAPPPVDGGGGVDGSGLDSAKIDGASFDSASSG
jgi:hypothetical protein